MLPARWLARLEALREKHGRRAAQGVLLFIAVLGVNNVWTLARNQRELPPFYRFHRSPRDLEHEARDHQRQVVKQWMAVFYFLQNRIAGHELIIPRSVAEARWELENVALVKLQVVDKAMKISAAQADVLRGMKHETRPFRLGRTRRTRWFTKLHLLRDPKVRRGYVLVRHQSDLFVLSRRQLAALSRPGKS